MMKLNLPRRTKRRLPKRIQQPMAGAARPNVHWSMDFMSDTLYQGRRFRTLNVLDEGVREILDIVIDTSVPGARDRHPVAGAARKEKGGVRAAADDTANQWSTFR